MKNVLLLLFASASLALGSLAWMQSRELAGLRAQQPALAESQTRLQKQLDRSKENIRELERQLEDAKKAAQTAEVTAPLAAPIAADGQPSSPEAAVGAALPAIASLMDRPELQRAMATQQKLQIERRFAQLFKQLNLPEDQERRLRELLIERETAPMDTLLAAAQKGINPLQNQEELKKLVQTSQTETDAQIKALLGDDTYKQYQEYRQLEAQRNTVAQLQQNLGYTDAPLNYAQATQLTRLLAETNPRKTGNTASTGTNISDEAIARSSSFLTPTQVQGLSNLQKQQQAAAAARVNLFPRRN